MKSKQEKAVKFWRPPLQPPLPGQKTVIKARANTHTALDSLGRSFHTLDFISSLQRPCEVSVINAIVQPRKWRLYVFLSHFPKVMHLITKEARLDAEQFSFYFPALFLSSPASPPLWDCLTGGWSEGRTKLFLIKHEGTFSILSHSLGDSYLWIWIPQTWSNDGVNIQYSTGYLITLVKTCLQFSRESLHNTLGSLLSTLLIKLHIFHTNLTLKQLCSGKKKILSASWQHFL